MQAGKSTSHMMKGPICAALMLATGQAMADPISDWNVQPYSLDLGNAQFSLGGSADGAIYTNEADGNHTGATGSLLLTPKLRRDYDSGLGLSLQASILAYHDELSGLRYGGDVFEKVFFTLQTGLGRVEIGQADGAAYALSVAGPKVDPDTSIDDADMSFFRDPSTGHAFIGIFPLRSEVMASSNYAKLSYFTPRLFGMQFAASFTPSQGKDVVPFVNDGPSVPDRQKRIWETALSYSDTFGDATVKAYAGASMAHDAARTEDHQGLTDWALGASVDYPLNDDVKLSVGGAYRDTNACAFDLDNVLAAGSTKAAHVSAEVTYDSWAGGFEYSTGTADGSPRLGVDGYETTIGYRINANLQLSGGWQHLSYRRDSGAFFNGDDRISMDAEFIHLKFHV
jgi:outer membrane protein OmpU